MTRSSGGLSTLLLKNWNGVAGSLSVGQLLVNPCGSFTPLSFGFPRPVQLKSVQQDFLVTISVNGNRDPPVPNNNHAYDHPPCPPEGCEDDVNGYPVNIRSIPVRTFSQ